MIIRKKIKVIPTITERKSRKEEIWWIAATKGLPKQREKPGAENGQSPVIAPLSIETFIKTKLKMASEMKADKTITVINLPDEIFIEVYSLIILH